MAKTSRGLRRKSKLEKAAASESETNLAEINREQPKQLNFRDWIHDNTLWLLGLIPVGIALYKLTLVSSGDTATLLALLSSTNPVDLLIATMIPIIPSLLFWSAVWAWEWRRRQSKAFKRTTAVAVPLIFAVVALAVITALPLLLLASSLAILVVLYGWLAVKVHRGKAKWSDYRLEVWMVIVLTVLNAIVSPAMSWMPAEVIDINNRTPIVGHVISSDPRWFVFMDDDGILTTVPAVDVKGRTNCKAEMPWYFQSITEILPSAKSNPNCPD